MGNPISEGNAQYLVHNDNNSDRLLRLIAAINRMAELQSYLPNI